MSLKTVNNINKNKKTFRDRGSGFTKILSYRFWDNWRITRA